MIGIFRMYVPLSHGGLELDLPKGLEIIEALGRIDGSVGWTAMIGSTNATFLTLLPRETYEQVYRNGPDVIGVGSSQPAGTAEAVDGGWRVNGRWPFASGCQHANLMVGLCVVTEGGRVVTGSAGEGGAPLIRGFYLPAREPQGHDGLRGELLRFPERRAMRVGSALSSRVPHSFRWCSAPSSRVWLKAPWTNLSSLPIWGGSSCGPLCRCGSRKRSNMS